jgi:hypothetical protein
VNQIRWSLVEGRESSSVFKRLAVSAVAFVGFVLTVVGTTIAQVEIAPPAPVSVRPMAPPVQLDTHSYNLPSSPQLNSSPPALAAPASADGGPPPANNEHAEGVDCEVAYRNCANSYCFPLDHSRWNSYRECIGDMCKIDSKSCLDALVDDLEGRD